MRRILPHTLWIGNEGDARDLRRLLDAGIAALIDLAIEESPVAVTHELIYCRLPLQDGAGNPPWLLQAAVNTTASLVRADVPTLLTCGQGLSRSPAVAALALSVITREKPEQCLQLILQPKGADVSPQLWHDLLAAMHS